MRQYRAKLYPLVKEFCELGCSIKQICEHTGFTWHFINRIIKEYDIVKPKGTHNYCSINTDIKGYKHIGYGNKRFNIVVYECYYQPVPDGWDVHHIDCVKTNNHPNNLVALPHGIHQSLHRKLKLNDTEGVTTILTEYLQVRGSASALNESKI